MAEFNLRIGQHAAVRPRWWGKAWSVIYGGMIGEKTYSIVVMWTMGYNSAAYNLFLCRDQQEIDLPVGRISVSGISAEELRFRFQSHRGRD